MSVGFRHKAKQFKVGDYIALKKKEGYIRYIGKREHHHGIWYGIELTAGEGPNDGSEHGKRYFSAQPCHGIFVRLYNIKKLLNPGGSYPCKLSKSPLTGTLPTLPQSTTLSDNAASSHDGSSRQPSPRDLAPQPPHAMSPRRDHQRVHPPVHQHHAHSPPLPHNPPVAYKRSPRHHRHHYNEHERPESTRSTHQSLKLAAWHKPAPRPKSTRASWASLRLSHGHRSSKQSIHSSHTTHSAPTYFQHRSLNHKSPKLNTGNSFNSNMSRSYSAATGLATSTAPATTHMVASNGRRSPKTPSLTPSVMDSPMTATPVSPHSMSPHHHSVTFNESAAYSSRTPQSSFKQGGVAPPSVFTPRGHHKNDTVEIIVDDRACYTPTPNSVGSASDHEHEAATHVNGDREHEEEDDDGYYSDERNLERTSVYTPSFSASRSGTGRPATRRFHELISPKFFHREGEQHGSAGNVILPMDRAATISVTDKIAAVTNKANSKRKKMKHEKDKKSRKRSRSKSKERRSKKDKERERKTSKSKAKRKHSSKNDDYNRDDHENVNANLMNLRPCSTHDRYETDIAMMESEDVDLFDDRQRHDGKHRKHKKHKKQHHQKKKQEKRKREEENQDEDEDDDYYSMSPQTNPNMTDSQKLIEIDRIKQWTINETKHKRKSRTVDFEQSQQDRDHLAQIMQIREELVSETSEEDDPDVDEYHDNRDRANIQSQHDSNPMEHVQSAQHIEQHSGDHDEHHSKKEQRELKQKRFQLPPLIRPQSAGKYRFRLHLKNKSGAINSSLTEQTEQLMHGAVIDEDDEMDQEMQNEYKLELPYKQKAMPLKLRQSYSINQEDLQNAFGPHLSLQIHDSNEEETANQAVAVVGPYGPNESHASSTSNVAHAYDVTDAASLPHHHHHHHLPQSSQLQIEQNKLGLLKKAASWNLQLAPDTPRDSDSDRVDDVYDNNVLYPNNNKMRKLFLENNDNELEKKLLSHSPSKADEDSENAPNKEQKHRARGDNKSNVNKAASSASSSSASSLSSDDDDDDDDLHLVHGQAKKKRKKLHHGKAKKNRNGGTVHQQSKIVVSDRQKENDDILFISRNNEVSKHSKENYIDQVRHVDDGIKFEIEESVIEYHVPSKAKKQKNQNIKINIHINNDIISKKKKSNKKHKSPSKGNHVYSHSNGDENIGQHMHSKHAVTDPPVVVKKKGKHKTKKKASKRSKHQTQHEKTNGLNRAYSMDQRHTARRTRKSNESSTPRPQGHRNHGSSRSPKRNCSCQKHHECDREARSPRKKHESATKSKKDKCKQIKFRSKTAKPLTPQTPIPPISSKYKQEQNYDWTELV